MYRLIIADDEKAACKRLELFTKQEFPEIEIADIVNDGYELVRRVEELKPDIAIVDVNMPGMNGIEAIKLLHEREVKTRFIINTAYDEFDYVKQALDLKVDAYLLKPERKENFLETIRKICESIRKEQEETDTKMQRELLLLDMQEVLESDIVYSILRVFRFLEKLFHSRHPASFFWLLHPISYKDVELTFLVNRERFLNNRKPALPYIF